MGITTIKKLVFLKIIGKLNDYEFFEIEEEEKLPEKKAVKTNEMLVDG